MKDGGKQLYNGISCFSLLKKTTFHINGMSKIELPFILALHMSQLIIKKKSIKMKLLNYKSSLLFI